QLQIDHLYEGAHLTGDAPHETAPRLFGGFAFNTHYAPSGIWSAFPSAYFMLPKVQFTQIADRTWLTLSRNIEADVSYRSALRQLRHEADELAHSLAQRTSEQMRECFPVGSLQRISYPLAREDWRYMITETTGRIRSGTLNKVVLSRVCDVEFTDP